MPSKKRKYNARFPAGRIKKIMQTDEEVGKVAQAVPIIISRTLELFVESLLNKALRVTMSRNAKTLSPSHVKQCILAEARFDFLKDLVKNIPDVSIAEEKEMMNDENSPNSSRFSDTSGPHRRLAREDSNSSSSSDIRVTSGQAIYPPKDLRRGLSAEAEKHKVETVTSALSPTDGAIDLSIKSMEEHKPVIRTANFYQETMPDDQPKSVITLNPSYGSPQPSTSSYANLTPVEPLQRLEKPVPKREHKLYLDIRQNNTSIPSVSTPVKPLINIDFSKDLAKPEIKVLDKSVADMVGVPKNDKKVQRQNSRSQKAEVKKVEAKTVYPPTPVTMGDNISGDLLIDEDYDT